MEEKSGSPFVQKVRVRVCGLLVEDDQIWLVRHEGLGPLGYFWSPPGGGVEFGETVEETLKREFMEETSLEIECLRFVTFHEHIDSRFHALELFFEVRKIAGSPALGTDPELTGREAMMTDLRLFGREELSTMPPEAIHSCVVPFLSGGFGN
ncbi:MAG TPA: NUDIX hydrolase [Catalimonadaceae bacterium]|nr:NUDIX hydrolase [Catalimonadaceae bacterium]HPI10734.1 NUDIX hydrolase [Catalimonadaceae bacterium]